MSSSDGSSFETLFGRPLEFEASAPGRVNLMGEHTDYNGGFVLPTAIPRRTAVQLARRSDQIVRAHSSNLGTPSSTESYHLGEEQSGRGWLDYVQGVTYTLQLSGYALGGFDLRIASTVPVGAGLSSSAALEVAILRSIRAAFQIELDDLKVARLAQRAENEFVGVPVGIMDQVACSVGEVGEAIFLDTRSLHFQRIRLPASVEVAVIDSGVAHELSGGDYRLRRAECELACEKLGVGQLRELDATGLPRAALLPTPLNRRVRHVVTENERVLAMVSALEREDLPRIADLLYESHRSQRDDYEVSIPEIDLLVDLAAREPAVIGARLTGGGFGGSIVLLIHQGHGRTTAAKLLERYTEQTGQAGTVVIP